MIFLKNSFSCNLLSASEYKNSQGYIEKNKKNESILAVGEYAKELYESKKIKEQICHSKTTQEMFEIIDNYYN